MFFKNRSATLLPILWIVLGATPMFAQENVDTGNTEDTHSEIVVTASREASLTVDSPEQAAERLRQIPGGTSFLLAEDYKRWRASTMKDTLDYSPGVVAQPRFGSDEARISIRGSGLQRTFHGRGLKLLQDGIPLNLADGGFDMQAVEPLASDYVEVYRGANALRYGAANLGGAINYVSANGHTASPAQARFEAGSFGYLRGQVSSGMAFEDADYYVSATQSSQDGFREHSQQNNQRLFSNFGWKITPQLENRLYVTAVQTDSELPGNLTKAQMEADPEQAAAANITGDQHRDFTLLRVADRLAYIWDNQKIETSVHWSHKDLDHPIFQVVDQNSNDLGYTVQYTNDGFVDGRQNRFTLGLSQILGMTNEAFYLNNGGERGSKTLQDNQTATESSLFFENSHYVLPQLAVVLGGQFLLATRDIDVEFSTAGARSANESYTAFNPKAGFIYDVTSQSQIYGNISRSSEPPSFSELRNTTGGTFTIVDAQKATTVEIGTRGEEGPFAWDLSYYYAWIEDELLALNDAAGNPVGTVNATSTIHQGVELGFSSVLYEGMIAESTVEHPADKWVLRQVYNWSDFRFASDPVYGDNRLAGVPEHIYRAELLYRHPCGFYAGPNVEWVITKSTVDHANSFYADPYALMGFRAGYQSRKGFSLFVEGKNLTDETYASTTGVVADAKGADTAQFLPGDGRGFYGGVEWRW